MNKVRNIKVRYIDKDTMCAINPLEVEVLVDDNGKLRAYHIINYNDNTPYVKLVEIDFLGYEE